MVETAVKTSTIDLQEQKIILSKSYAFILVGRFLEGKQATLSQTQTCSSLLSLCLFVQSFIGFWFWDIWREEIKPIPPFVMQYLNWEILNCTYSVLVLQIRHENDTSLSITASVKLQKLITLHCTVLINNNIIIITSWQGRTESSALRAAYETQESFFISPEGPAVSACLQLIMCLLLPLVTMRAPRLHLSL